MPRRIYASNESELLLTQFKRHVGRRASSLEESTELTQELDLEQYYTKWQAFEFESWQQESLASRRSTSDLFLFDVLNLLEDSSEKLRLQQGFIYLANSLCAITETEMDDVHGLQKLLEHSGSLCSLGLEYLSGGQENLARRILTAESPKTLFRLGLTMMRRLQSLPMMVLRASKYPQAEKLFNNWKTGKCALVLRSFDKNLLTVLGFESVECLKALFDLLPLGAKLETSTESEAVKVSFAPIANMVQYRELAKTVMHLTAQMELAHAVGFKLDLPWQTQVNNRLVASILGKVFHTKADWYRQLVRFVLWMLSTVKRF